MELVANVWPVADQMTGLVQRFFMRAYAMDAADAVISDTLTSLAPTDFLTARLFPVPSKYRHIDACGTLQGCVPIGDFHLLQSGIIEPAMRELEASGPPLLGISINQGKCHSTGERPTFPAKPYLVTTTLVETPDGRLIPQLPNR